MSVLLDAAHVQSIAEMAVVASVNMNSPGTRDAEIVGTQVLQGSQIKQFVDAGYDGEFAANTDVPFAVIEFDDYRDEHFLFRDTSTNGARILSRTTCTSASCTSLLNFPNPSTSVFTNAHATIDLGIIMGDLRDGQDPGQVTPVARVDRSGYAGEAWGHLYKTTASAGGMQRALDDVLTVAPIVRVVNMSLSAYSDDPKCTGQTPLNRDLNDMFELGTLVFKSAGNSGHASASDCTIGSPGAAIGAFTVGAHGNSEIGTEGDVRGAKIFGSSARGGAGDEGALRSIVDLTAFGYRSLLPWIAANDSYLTIAGGTSFATPTVTAAAINFIDFYKRANNSNFVDNPGVLFANMLLMGDRQGESGKLSTGFDALFGAGRMKMRLATAAGMDAPALWKTGWACVGDGAVFTVPVNSGAKLSAAVNDFKAVLFWYDRRHETGAAIDDLDLELHTVGGTTPLKSSADQWDNKERVYHSAIGGQAVELRIVGYNVTADVEGCGNNSQLVYYAYFYEDDARDDPEGPTSNVIDRE